MTGSNEPFMPFPGLVCQRDKCQLKTAQEVLVASRVGHEPSVQDLRAADEDLQSMDEECRSTAEELETSKEELHTVNAELKNKLEGTSVAHGDLQT